MISSFNHKLGYYLVNNQVVKNKIDALVMATRLNCDITWHFNDQAWNTVKWDQEPETDILELYKKRARQIREQYDYVIINFSAGSDSATVVQAFLESGCHIDEITTIWNRKQTPKVILDPGCTDPRNVEAEYDLVTKPALDKIRLLSPLTKITYLDVSDHIVQTLSRLDGEEWLSRTSEHLNPQMLARYDSTLGKDRRMTLDRGRKTAVVFGVDKPKVCIKDDGRYYVYFVDSIPNQSPDTQLNLEYENVEHVFFYWTPDMPEILVKQAHILKRWFQVNDRLKHVIRWPQLDHARRTVYEAVVRGVIYPWWDPNTFQVNKTTSTVFSEWDSWFFDAHRGSAVDNWLKGVEYVQTAIDKKYLKYSYDGRFEGFHGMINGHFCLDPVES